MNRKVGVVGLGYVGLPVAVAFGRIGRVIAFDINDSRIEELKAGCDRTNEVDGTDLEHSDIEFTGDSEMLRAADFIIVSVPTPINEHNQPDLSPLIRASETVGSVLAEGAIVVFESTVYPGATEEVCIPVLEKFSGLDAGIDFHVGYSPERINPGDREHTFEKITKVVSGQTEEVTDIIAEVYRAVIKAGVYKAENIQVAEAAKVIENIQRDVNIALMNELAVIFNKIGISTREVLAAAGTKWNFLKFSPGLVGGHCIGVDPYYLTHKAQAVGHHPEVILAGRRINDNICKHIISSMVKTMLCKGLAVQGTTINMLGLTFKENTPDLRNTKVINLIEELREFGFGIVVHDPVADPGEAERLYGIDLREKEELVETNVMMFAVCHDEYRENRREYLEYLSDDGLVIDIKGIIDQADLRAGQTVWRL
ncbi:GDP-mannose dehydrogenase [Salinicoccus sediminis]|uniref:GDP-mannose dehydrogenase n=1 Tax=Salinicoccus sediminis TaxID=1432562 RepID=A0A0M2SM37_9STAP|nr:nucleotide sugar dehydrogenase [Salinicoccus sediminis]KKK33917.1 GDP-mannose dehydrogenase [Salinicoccus sediminis]